MIGVCKALLGPISNILYDITAVTVNPDDLDRLKGFRGQRMVLLPNHPSHGDPAVLFGLSKQARENWYYLSSREQFDRWFGLYGRLLQYCGTFSIARGTLDRGSFSTTRRLLVEGPNKLVIFAEGGNYSWNDLEAPFQEGLFKLLVLAAAEMREKGMEDPLWIQPVSLKYVYGPQADSQIRDSLVRLEDAIGLSAAPQMEFRERIFRIGGAVVTSVEQNFFGKTFPQEEINARIIRVREEMLHRFAQALGTSTPNPESGTLLERTRVLFDQFFRVSSEGALPRTAYEETLFEQDILAKRSIRRLLDRLENWAALREGYVDQPDRTRQVEILSRLEREVLGAVLLHPKRRCEVRLGEPFNLMERVPETGKPPKDLAREITRETEERVRVLLHDEGGVRH